MVNTRGFIGIGVCVVSRILVCLLVFANTSLAANPYKLGEIDYFQKKIQKKTDETQVFDFREVTISPEGQANVYQPPPIMLRLLEDPTEDNARAYVSWQKERMQRIIKVQQLIEQVNQKKTKNDQSLIHPVDLATNIHG